MSATTSGPTDTYPLFLTRAAQAGRTLPSSLLAKQIYILLGAGVSWERLNPDLRAAYLLGFYLGNVRNGGHSQFMGNARKLYDGDPMRFLAWAMEAADRYKMPKTLNIMRDVQTWMAENPKETATQTGFTPHVSPALKPFDRALFDADTVDEETWLTRVNTLPAAHAQAFLHMQSYNKGFVSFPAIVSEIEELRFLVAYKSVKIVAEDTFEAEVRAAAAADPIARAACLNARLADLARTLPKPATCAALSLFADGAHLPPTQCLRAGAAKIRRPKNAAVLTTVHGDHVYVVELGKSSVKVFEAAGDPDAVLESSISFDFPPRGLAASLLGFLAPRRPVERALKRLVRQKAVRKTSKLGDVANSVGDEIAALNKRFHLPEALALWLDHAQENATLAKWRLERVENNRILWLFETAGARLSVIASATEVAISTSEDTKVYQHGELCALRKNS